MICLDCDTTFTAITQPDGFLVVVPFFEDEDKPSIVTGICPRCCARPLSDLNEAVLRRLRTIWPDARVGIGNA
jgi:hypothetical protein